MEYAYILRAKTVLKFKNMLLWYLNMKSLKYKEISINFLYKYFNSPIDAKDIKSRCNDKWRYN
jgi:hypothetical protein